MLPLWHRWSRQIGRWQSNDGVARSLIFSVSAAIIGTVCLSGCCNMLVDRLVGAGPIEWHPYRLSYGYMLRCRSGDIFRDKSC
eukprot:scaffold1378_cov149-Skeletonema_dohrnii-CCMP3373.AAC.17